MIYAYPVTLTADDNGTVLVGFPDIPFAHTFGDDEGEALARAVDALESAFIVIIAERGDIPAPSKAARGQRTISLPTLSAVKVALERQLPILAVCRGIQLLNVALGGTLFQDVGTDPGTQLQHSQRAPRDQPTHKVKVQAGSRLAETLGTDELEVNSMHHQAVKALGAGLAAVAWAPDQIVEGIEMTAPSRCVLGVQWHPEDLRGHSEPARGLFAALIGAARS